MPVTVAAARPPAVRLAADAGVHAVGATAIAPATPRATTATPGSTTTVARHRAVTAPRRPRRASPHRTGPPRPLRRTRRAPRARRPADGTGPERSTETAERRRR